MTAKNKINANPTKEFFITMLTRDIATDRAILDLIDNSIDAATQNNSKNPKIEITATSDFFEIRDNCGGLSLETARNYAFRFGRDPKAPKTPGSVGQFGVGMKRTLFKLGDKFQVESNHKNSAYNVSVDAAEWVKLNEWSFYFQPLRKTELKNGETLIKVTNLNEESSSSFGNKEYLDNLSKEISSAYFRQINSGIEILLNKKIIKSKEITIKVSEELKPIKKITTYDSVKITITCGLSKRSKEDSGWYISCNDRLVTEAEKTDKTGWGKSGVPKFHTDFAFFRGLVEFSCDDASKLPWTTTKTGIDGDSKIYKHALNEMNKCMQPILAFLRERTEESTFHIQEIIEDTPLTKSIEKAEMIRISDVQPSDRFIRPERIVPPLHEKSYTTITYTISNDRLERAKEALNVKSATQVGKLTFDYHHQRECEDE